MLSKVLEVMDEYAKQEAIGFLTWLNRSKYFLMNFTFHGEYVYRDATTEGGPTDYSITTLYQQYLNSKTNAPK